MDYTILVSSGIEGGRRFLEELDARRVFTHCLMWIYNPDLEDWLLTIVTPLAEKKGRKDAFLRILEIRREMQPVAGFAISDLSVESSVEETAKIANAALGAGFGLVGTWSGGLRLAGRYIDHIYTYRALGGWTVYRDYRIGREILAPRDTTFRMTVRAFPPLSGNLQAFERTLAMTDELAASGDKPLLDRSGPQPRVWQFLSAEAEAYMHRLVDVALKTGRDPAPVMEELRIDTAIRDFHFHGLSSDDLYAREFLETPTHTGV